MLQLPKQIGHIRIDIPLKIILLILTFYLLIGVAAFANPTIEGAPTDITLSHTTVGEGQFFDRLIANLSTTDADPLDTHTYSLVAGIGDDDNDYFFTSTNNAGSLKSNELFDFETKDTYSIRLETNDGNGGTFQKAFTITVLDFAEHPTQVLLDNNSITENQPIGTLVALLTAVDDDAGDTHTFSLIQNDNHFYNSYYSIVGNELRTSRVMDYETNNFHIIRIQVTDNTGRSFDRPVNMTVIDEVVENQFPTNINLSPRTINEENTIGDLIGTLTTIDADAGDTHTYTLIDGVVNNDQFTITGDQLKADAVFDYETKSNYVVQVKTDDGDGGVYVKNISVFIGNVAESGPPTSTTLSSYSIEENNDLFDPVGNFLTTDPDAGDTFTYALVAGGGSGGNVFFRIVGNELQAKAIFDYENIISYSIRVNTTDSQGNSFVANYTITIDDLDDLGTLDIRLQSTSVNENTASGTFDSRILPSNTQGSSVFVDYQLVAGTGDDDNSSFSIFQDFLTLNEVADYETKKTYSVRVEADDQGNLIEKVLLITVNDVNEAPTFINVSTTEIEENNVVGQVVAVLSTNDPDEGDTFTYSFASPEPEFTIDGNLILANESFDFEAFTTSYLVVIRSQDAGSQFAPDRTVRFDINNQNEVPTDVSIFISQLLYENSPAGAVVGTLSTTDPDDGDSHTYGVVSGFGDGDSFEFSGNQLVTTEPLNYEEKTSYTIRVQSEDVAGGQFVKDLPIQLYNRLESPFNIDLTNTSINENNAVGAVIGTLSAEDPDNGDTFTFFILETPADGLSFDIANGNELVADESFDFEDQSSFTIEIRVSDGNNSYFESFTISINDLFENNAPTDITLSDNAFEETRTIGYTIGSFATADADADETYMYTFVEGAGDDDNDNFSIVGSQLRVAASFDFEVQSTHSIRVQTEDSNGGTFQKVFSILVENDPEAPTDITISSTSIDEANDIGDVIGSFTTEDQDIEDTHTYEILTIGGSADHTAFTIDDGDLEAAIIFDFETQSSYTIRIRTEDAIGDTFTKDFVITINDIVENNIPTDISLSASSIDENNSVNDVIGTLSSTDADGGDTHTYSLVTNPGSSFNINNNELRANEPFDFETTASYDIRIETDDQNGGVFEKDFTITVNDINENQAPTAIALSLNTIDENNEIGATIGTLTSTDVDAGDTHIYSLQNFLAFFTIEGDQLKADIAFDFEDRDNYIISIQTDDGNGGTFTQDVTITVNDINDNAPTDFTLTATSIDENNEIGDLIGVVSSTDADAGDTHTYSLVDNPGFLFRIVGDRLEANAFFNFESQDSYDITIRTTDGITDFQKEVTISINDINDLPDNIGLTNASITEGNAVDDLIGILGTSDEDAGATHTYTLESNPGNAFKVNGNSLEANIIFDFDAQSSYPITVRSTDNLGGFKEKNLTITILALVDNVGPQIVSFTPVDGTEGILQSQELVVTLNEPIKFGAGQIQVISAGGSGQQVINATGTSGQDVISISGSELTIHLDGDDRIRDLFFGGEYYVTISAGAVQDLADNQLTNPITAVDTWTFFADKEPTNIVFDAIADKSTTAAAFDVSVTTNNIQTAVVYSILSGPASIDGSTITLTGELGTVNVQAAQVSTQRFKAANVATTFEVIEEPDVVGPQIVSFTPADDAVDIPLDGELVVTFDEPVQFGNGLIRVIRAGGSGQEIINTPANSGDNTLSISGSQLTIDLGGSDRIRDLFIGGEYYVTIGATAIRDLSNNDLANPIGFSDQETWSFFAEKGEANLAFVAIPNKTTNSGSFDVEATTDNPQRVVAYSIVSGPGTIDGATVTLTGEAGTVIIQATQDESPQYNAASITTTFEVTDMTAPQIISFTPLDDAVDVPLDGELVVTFDEPIVAGASSILVRTVAGGSFALSGNATDNPDIFEISGNTLTIQMSNANNFGFTNNQNYYVTINASAVKDLAGNNFTSGITNQTDWNFTTERRTVTWSAGAWSNGTGPSFGFNVVIDDDYSVDEDGFFSTHDLVVNPGNNLTVDGGTAMQVLGDLTNGGVISIESGFSLLTFEGNEIIGNDIIIKRNTRYADGKYSFVGSPVEQNASTTAFDLGDPAHHVYTYEESVPYGADGINRWSLASSQELIPGKGYAQAFQKEITFEGRPNDGTITYSGTYTEDIADANEGWNLVANPYPIAISVADFLTENDNTTGSVYIWDDNGSDTQRGSNSDYIVANGSMASATNAGGESRYNFNLGSSQGFFVKLGDNTDTDILFTEEMRVAGKNEDGNFFRETQLPIVRLNLTNPEGLFKQAVIGFAGDATVDQINSTYDAQAFNASTDNGLFTLKAGRTLTLNGMPNDWEAVQLQFNASEAGQFTIAVELEGYGGALYLRDNLTGEVVDLLSESYSFAAESGIDTDRFRLISQPDAVLGLTQNTVLFYVNEKVLSIQQFDSKVRTYQIFNMNGKRLLTTSVKEEKQVNLGAYPAGIYLIFDGQQTRKIILH